MKLADYRQISPQINADLAALFEKHGFKLKPFGAKIDETLGIVRMTLECHDVNHKAADGSATNPERELFKRFAATVGLLPEWLDRELVMNGGTKVTIDGMKPRGKKCLVVKRATDGVRLVTTPEAVLTYLAARGDETAKKNLPIYG